ncbi:hypothetical protein [Streptomyces sp. NPDC050534]|uniref:hypothetical protein n=1 Tax=Streptomyces sp. NPDC050534 TaxID=3365625 RepID=UPI00379A86E5
MTATPSALGMPATPEHRLAAAQLRGGEPWFEETFPSYEEWLAGETDFDPAFAPFPSGEAPVPSSPGRTGPGVCGRSGQRWVLGRCS